MKIKTSSLNRKIKILTLKHNGQYMCHITYHKGNIMEYLANLLDWTKALGTASSILVGLVAWFFFSLALMGCQGTAPNPEEQDYTLPPICALSDSTVRVFGKTYKAGKTKKATVYVDSDGALWLRWPDGTQKSYNEGQVYYCKDYDSLWVPKIKGEE